MRPDIINTEFNNILLDNFDRPASAGNYVNRKVNSREKYVTKDAMDF